MIEHVESLRTFRKVKKVRDAEATALPATNKYRNCTDPYFILIFGLMHLITACFFISQLHNVNTDKMVNEYDACGNYCGLKNTFDPKINCSGQDNTNKKYLEYLEPLLDNDTIKDLLLIPRHCVKECAENFVECGSICFPSDLYGEDVCNLLQNTDKQTFISVVRSKWYYLLLSIIETACICAFMLVVLHSSAYCLIYGSIVICELTAIGSAIYSWITYFNNPTKGDYSWLISSLGFTALAIVPLIIVFLVRQEIQLSALLLVETSKAIIAVERVATIQVLSMAVTTLVVSGYGYTIALATTDTYLKQIGDHKGFYVHTLTPLGICSIVLLSILAVWSNLFLQHVTFMIISGAVVNWYFRDDDDEYLVLNSIQRCFRYHLGSICFGSLIVTLVDFLRKSADAVGQIQATKWAVDACMSCIQDLTYFVSQNAFVEISIHGQPFIESGERAAILMVMNVLKLGTVKTITQVLLFSAKTAAVMIPFATIYLLTKDSMFTGMCTGISTLIMVIYAQIFTTVIDSLFVCYLEDLACNDGVFRPYYMARGLRDFTENVRNTLGEIE